MTSQRQPRSTVGVLGLGNMGRPMTLNLLRSGIASVVVHGRTRATLDEAEAAGATVAPTVRELAAQSDIVLSMLPDLPQLRDLLDGPDGLLAGLDHPLLLIVGSTSAPDGIRELAAELDSRTDGLVRVLDAPVSGGTDGAEAAALAIMVGGDPDDFARAEPVLATMGTPVLLGPLGSGEVAKACNQMIVASTIVALSEATVIAERAGLDVTRLLDLLGGGYAGSRLLESRKQRLAEKDYSVSGPAKFMVKDLGFARAEAERTATATPQLTTLQDFFRRLVEAGLGDDDITVAQGFIAASSPATEHTLP